MRLTCASASAILPRISLSPGASCRARASDAEAAESRLASEAASGVPLLAALLSPDRWLLWLGVLFVLSVYHFPTGIVGRLRALALRHR